MSWNYRVVRRVAPNGEEYFGLHEVYYNDKGQADGMTADPAGFVGDTREELIESLRLALKDAVERPVYEEAP